MDDGPGIPEIGFHAPRAPQLGFEVLSMSEVRRRTSPQSLERVHRAEFHTITLVRAGVGRHTVDFVSYPCAPHTLLWVRPGQVQRFHLVPELTGIHLLFLATFALPLDVSGRPVTVGSGTCWQLHTRAERASIVRLVNQLREEYSGRDHDPSRQILQHLLAVLILRIHRLPRPDGHDRFEAGGVVYARFVAELERSYATTRRAEDYAARLGYSVKTLTRACLAATGHPVKHVIDARVTLEAQRRLAHTDEPVAVIARRLGFTEATNFSRFFLRHTAIGPADFRRSQLGS